ncbi:MAG: TonB-dependent receptor [Bacteroidales bacterium]|jgi:iron complex outermembrane receptor protein|nr:TonB-dependent receptor [Bacteroidales bacterium]
MAKQFFIFVFLLATAVNLSAQEDSVSRSIDEVVITATRTQARRNNVPMTVSVVNREEIEESSESALLPVLSGRVPGMFVTERSIMGFGVGSSGAGSISLRGVGGGTELLLLIDGHPHYMGIMGHHLPDAFVASDAEKVEVIRGPASLLYGSNAMGGVINVITRKQEAEGWNVNGRIMYGSYNTHKYQVGAGWKKGKFSGLLSVNHDRTDGNRTNPVDGDRKSGRFNITNGYAKFGYQFSDHIRAWGDLSIASYETKNPGSTATPMFDNVADILRGVASVTLENNFNSTNGAFNFFYNFGNHKIDDGYEEGSNPSGFYFRSNDHNYGFTWYQIFRPFTGNTITAGIDFKNFGGRAWDDYKDGVTPDNVNADTSLYEMAGYIVVQQTLFKQLTLNVGVRFDNNEQFGPEWIPQAGLAYRPLKYTVVKASVSKGFRSPNIRELFYKAGWAGANPDLKPEKMINYELSIGQELWNGRFSFELTGFIADGSNLIVTDWSSGYPPQNKNSGYFKNSGVELSVKWKALKNLNVQGNYAYLHMDTPVVYAPEQQFYFAASYQLNKWTFSANYQHVGNLYSNSAVPDRTETYGLLDAKATYRPLKWLNVFAKGENLTDREYQIRDGFPMPGITVFGGVNISLK